MPQAASSRTRCLIDSILDDGSLVRGPMGVAEECIEKQRRFIRDSDDLVRCLTVELEIELRFWAAVIPACKAFEFPASQGPLGECRALYSDAHTGCLAGDAGLLLERYCRSDHAPCDEART